jgi:pimeloyl-ACP methyl ester carboxylesterase
MPESLDEHAARMLQTSLGEMWVLDVGSGSPVVLLHGGGPGASGWSNFKHNVGPLAEHFRVVVVDQPGFGRSHKPTHESPAQLNPYNAAAVLGVLDELGIEVADFVGNSMGGATALTVALERPERARRLVLMGTGGGMPIFSAEPSEGYKVLGGFYAPPGPTREKMRELVRVMSYDSTAESDELIDERLRAACDPDAMRFYAVMNEIFRSGKRGDLWRKVDQVTHETLLVWGRDDRTVPLDSAMFLLRQLPRVELHVFARCAHWVQSERAGEFNRLVTEFLTRP